mgnify:CR=1 FL=1
MATPKSKQGSKNAFWWSLETAKKEGYVLIDVNTMHIEFRNTTCILQEVVFDGDISGELTVPTGKAVVLDVLIIYRAALFLIFICLNFICVSGSCSYRFGIDVGLILFGQVSK